MRTIARPKDSLQAPGAFLTVAQVATRLSTTPPAIRARIARGVFPHVRLGRRVLIPERALQDFLSRLPGISATEALATVAARSRAVSAPVERPAMRAEE